MSYQTIATIQNDTGIRDRASACAAVEGVALPPEGWVAEHAWRLAAQPGWADAWEEAVTTHSDPSYDPGRDGSVITDAMILTAVRKIAEVSS